MLHDRYRPRAIGTGGDSAMCSSTTLISIHLTPSLSTCTYLRPCRRSSSLYSCTAVLHASQTRLFECIFQRDSIPHTLSPRIVRIAIVACAQTIVVAYWTPILRLRYVRAYCSDGDIECASSAHVGVLIKGAAWKLSAHLRESRSVRT